MKPSASLRVKLRKSPSEIQSTSALGKGCLCRHSEKPAPTVLERNHMNRCYQSAVRLPSQEIWRHLWDTNVQMGMFPKTALAFPTQPSSPRWWTHIWDWGLLTPPPPCVGGCRACAYLESILSSCLKFIWEGRRGFPCWQGANVRGAALLN